MRLQNPGIFSCITVASFFPLAVSMALETAADQPDLANARVVWGMGLATLTMPLVMGWAAELLSLQQAYAIVAVMLVSAMTIAWMSDHGGAAQPLGEMAVIRRETLDARTGGGLMHAHLTGNHRVDNLGNKRCSISEIRHG